MAKYCLGIDLGGTYVKCVAVDADRRPGAIRQVATPSGRGADAVAGAMAAAGREVLAAQGIAPGEVIGVGIGAPGPLRISEGIVVATPNISGMENYPLARRVGEALHLPTILENDANAAAFGEHLCGAGSGGDMVMLTLGTGVGSGIIIDGRILHGAHEIGGELGHMIVVPYGEECGCGQRGCLERYCSATYIAKVARRRIEEEGADSALAEILRRKGDVDAKDINDARKAGDRLAAEAWNQGAYYLALGCVNICRIFDPDEILLTGGMTKAGEDLMDPLLKHFRRLHWRLTEPKTRIAIAQLGNDAGAIGAAGVAWQAFGP